MSERRENLACLDLSDDLPARAVSKRRENSANLNYFHELAICRFRAQHLWQNKHLKALKCYAESEKVTPILPTLAARMALHTGECIAVLQATPEYLHWFALFFQHIADCIPQGSNSPQVGIASVSCPASPSRIVEFLLV